MTDASRRQFLTGEAVLKVGRELGERAADRISDAVSGLGRPRAFDTLRLETRAMACTWGLCSTLERTNG
ncbi:MAG: hypothetical protein R3B90_17195 [Planctomycetaceae bacterium]